MRSFVLSFLLLSTGDAFTVAPSSSVRQSTNLHASSPNTSRRDILTTLPFAAAATLLLSNPENANAGIDPSMLKSIPVEGDVSGAALRLKQIASETGERPQDTEDIPYTELPDGVKYRDYREGKGDAVVQAGSKVAVEMTIRCQSFSTNTEPGGVKYYSTKDDADFNEYAFTVGSGQISPAFEEGLVGMHKNGLRRIIVPSVQVFSAKKADQLPVPTTKDGKRRFENLFKTDATLLFEVLVTRIK